MARSGGQNSTFRGDDLPDYANRVDLFSFVAARMKQERNHAPLYDQMMHYCREYYDHVRMKADNVVHIIEQTVRDGILVRRKDRIGFRFNSIFSFFVAQRMKVDPAFYDSILREPSANALDICIYCGLNRNDANVLDIIREYLTALFDRLAAECGGSLPDVNYVNTYHPPRVRIVERMMAAHLGGLLEAE